MMRLQHEESRPRSLKTFIESTAGEARSMNSFSAFGGDYDKFASCVRTFFKNLRKCNVTAYVLFDGCHENKKLKTIFSRLRSKLQSCSHLDPVTQGNLQIFPFLVRDVFIEVLRDMKINYTICIFEADDEIASLARHLNCPVLSYDSDFFIYNVLYIPFNLLETKPKPIEEDGCKVHVMECKLYKVLYLCESSGSLKEELLPLLATLLGNDYVEKKVFGKFFSQLKLQKSKRKKNDQQRSIQALFNWLQNETLDSAIAKILGRLKKRQKDKVFKIMKKSIDGYHSNYCPSLKYFNLSKEISPKFDLKMPEVVNEDLNYEDGDSDKSGEDSTEEDENKSDPNLNNIPLWFSEKIRQNQIPKVYLNLYAHHLHLCNPQAEDYSDNDSFLSVLPFVRYAFDILTDFSYDYFVYVSRENCNYHKIQVTKDYSIPRPLDISFQELDNAQLRQYFLHFFDTKLPNLDWENIKLLPGNFQLIMISVLWWIANCSVPANHVHSIIISYIMLEVIDDKTGMPRGHYHFNNKHGKKLEELKKENTSIVTENELFLNKNKVQYEDCLIAASALLKHFEIDSSILKRPKSYDKRKIHSFAQFQCTLHQVNSLNILCGMPFESTFYSKCYNGTFIYNIALKLEKEVDPSKFFANYIKGASTIIHFYQSLCCIYNQLIKKMNISTVQWSGKKRNGKRRKVIDEELSFIIKGFESDVKI
ncbi:unnamed protein product, partial [Brenthis ino]